MAPWCHNAPCGAIIRTLNKASFCISLSVPWHFPCLAPSECRVAAHEARHPLPDESQNRLLHRTNPHGSEQTGCENRRVLIAVPGGKPFLRVTRRILGVDIGDVLAALKHELRACNVVKPCVRLIPPRQIGPLRVRCVPPGRGMHSSNGQGTPDCACGWLSSAVSGETTPCTRRWPMAETGRKAPLAR